MIFFINLKKHKKIIKYYFSTSFQSLLYKIELTSNPSVLDNSDPKPEESSELKLLDNSDPNVLLNPYKFDKSDYN